MNYRLFLGILGLAALATACASTGATPRPFPMPGSPAAPAPAAPAPAPSGAAPSGARASSAPTSTTSPTSPKADTYAITGTALSLRGSPYRSGGSDPAAGFDCSGFTQYVFGQHGVALPRAVADQFRTGKPVKTGDLEPGDLIFFSTTAPGASHVAIALGGAEFIHAPSSTGVVRVDRLTGAYWSQRFVGVRRMN